MFRLSNEDYFIEPLEGVPARPGHAQPHVVYKRQAPEKGAELGGSRAPGTCGVAGMVLSCPGKGMGLEAPSFFPEASLDLSMHTSPRTKGTQTDRHITTARAFQMCLRPEASACQACPS